MREIKSFYELIKDHLTPEQKFISYESESLTEPGENYGSIILSVKINLLNTTTMKPECIEAVAKLIPDSEFLRKVFNIQHSVVCEIGFYQTVFPTLRKFQELQGIKDVADYFPKFYGARLNLNGSNVVDGDAVLLLENLKYFRNDNRYEGVSFETAKLVLKDLANLHATAIALKLLQPEKFLKDIKTYLDRSFVFDEQPDAFVQILREQVEELLLEYPTESHLTDRVLKNLKKGFLSKVENTEPFSTIVHGDLWVNNTLLKFDGNRAVKNKFIDFQLPQYSSPCCDVIFYILSSVQNKVVETHSDDLLRYYYEIFYGYLKELKCDVSAFTLENYQNELKIAAKTEFTHCLIMVCPILAPKEDAMADMTKLKEEDMLIKKPFSQKQKDKLILTIREFAKRNWI